ncbi:hypothetical protein BDB00DRAFT_333271 [Zychaea mexicana]|uniref:uncharacterized protein n=1 Tax=Zychaea mexicana TaxID=64656 RepID=UPI0022FF2915|nr:uncharacterized protein BDB00DRAFT_333271 [Zychaea mexicana]KAI9499085.1 hypothetical protein BDB00DRAFT_333271 [Zychaea mexicana]
MLNNGSHTNSGSSKLSNLRREESFLVESSPLSSSSTSSSTATTTRYGSRRISRDVPVTAHTRSPLIEIGQQNSTSSTFHTAPMVPSLSDSSPNGLPLKTPSSPKKKKSVNFKSDHVLVQVRYYAKNTWETSDHPDGLIVDDRENEQGPEISNQHNGLPTKSHPTLENWQCPPRLLLAQDCRRAGMIYTEESNYQRQLEAITPPTVYRSIDEIPPTPEEPDSPGCENDIGVKIIPLEDLANYGDATSEECYNDEMDDSIPENNKGYSATTVDDSASVPIAPMSSSSSKEYPNLDYLDLQGILNAVASQTGASASTSSMTPTQQQQEQLAVPQHQVPSQRQHQYYQHDLKNQPPTQPSKHHNNNNNINHSTNPSRGNHHHPHRSSRGGAGAGRSDQHNGNNRPSRPPRGRARCRYLNTKKGCLFGDRCNYSHDI